MASNNLPQGEATTEVARRRLQHIGGLRAEEVFRHAAAEGGAEALVLRALHEDEQNDEQRHENVDHQKDINRDTKHGRGAEYGGKRAACKMKFSPISGAQVAAGTTETKRRSSGVVE